MDAERTPPVALEAEASVLGAMLLDMDAVGRAVEVLDESMFYLATNRYAFRSMARIARKGDAVDAVTLLADLTASGELELAGGRERIAELLDAVPSAANVEYHASLVADRALARRLIESASSVIRDAFEPGGLSAAELVDEAEKRIMAVSSGKSAGRLTPIRRDMMSAFELIESGGNRGVPSGVAELDGMLGGFRPGGLYVVAGDTSMGKSAAALQFAVHAALEGHAKVAIFSVEMTKEENICRMLANEALADLQQLMAGATNMADLERVTHVAGLLSHAPLWLDDSVTKVSEIRSRARRMKAEDGLGLIVVDHIHDMSEAGETRREQLGTIARGLKQVAKELHVPVVAAAQLNRQPAIRTNHRPQLSDLHESSDIAQASDCVLLLYRPEYYHGPVHDGKDVRGHAEIIVAKHRNGPTGDIHVHFRAHCTRFEGGPGQAIRRAG